MIQFSMFWLMPLTSPIPHFFLRYSLALHGSLFFWFFTYLLDHSFSVLSLVSLLSPLSSSLCSQEPGFFSPIFFHFSTHTWDLICSHCLSYHLHADELQTYLSTCDLIPSSHLFQYLLRNILMLSKAKYGRDFHISPSQSLMIIPLSSLLLRFATMRLSLTILSPFLFLSRFSTNCVTSPSMTVRNSSLPLWHSTAKGLDHVMVISFLSYWTIHCSSSSAFLLPDFLTPKTLPTVICICKNGNQCLKIWTIICAKHT